MCRRKICGMSGMIPVSGNIVSTYLLVGEGHPLVDLCSLLDVGGEGGLVGSELGNYGRRQLPFHPFDNPHCDDQEGMEGVVLSDNAIPHRGLMSTQVIKTGITEL